MKLTVLVDNHTYTDMYYYGEPGVSYYIEDQGESFLFDVGYSDLFLKNAAALGIDLGGLKKVVLSHGHDDHSGGLKYLSQCCELSKLELVAHPAALLPKILKGEYIGAPFTPEQMERLCRVVLSKMPVKISPNITFLGEIPTLCSFENRYAIGQICDSGGTAQGPDYLYDDTALVYEGKKGLYIITGCSHSGICNIAEYARKICGGRPIAGMIGGFHLSEMDGRTEETIRYLERSGAEALYPCHCVTFPVKAAIHQRIPIGEVGVGLQLEWE